MVRPLLASMLLIALFAPRSDPLCGQDASAEKREKPSPAVREAQDWAIAVPEDWKAVRDHHWSRPGDSVVPLLDGTLQPVQPGVVVERQKGRVTADAVKESVLEMEKQQTVTIRGEVRVREVTLAGDETASVVSVAMLKREGRRLAFYDTLVWNRNSDTLLVTGYLTDDAGPNASSLMETTH